jgi:hypothetical protein
MVVAPATVVVAEPDALGAVIAHAVRFVLEPEAWAPRIPRTQAELDAHLGCLPKTPDEIAAHLARLPKTPDEIAAHVARLPKTPAEIDAHLRRLDAALQAQHRR